MPVHQLPSGTVIVEAASAPLAVRSHNVAVYARVSSAENRKNLDSQAERVVAFCAARGWQVAKVVKECGSRVNDQRPRFLPLLDDTSSSHQISGQDTPVFRHGEEWPSPFRFVGLWQNRELSRGIPASADSVNPGDRWWAYWQCQPAIGRRQADDGTAPTATGRWPGKPAAPPRQSTGLPMRAGSGTRGHLRSQTFGQP